jgi:hypothetical protein
MNTKNLIRRAGSCFVATLFLTSAQYALAAAGKALFVSGTVNLERNGTRPLKVNDPVNVGDVVATGERSRAQLLMADGARIALRAGTRFRVDELALPTNVQQPGLAVAVASSGKSVTTLLKGGFSTRDGAIAKGNPAAYEMRTPVGTLGIRGTLYTAVLCRGDCADAPGLPPGQPIADGLYIAVDEGTITFNGRGLSLTLTAPAYQFIPLETGDPQPLANPPAFLRNDGAGALQLAGRGVRIAAVNGEPLSAVNERRSPPEGTVQTSGQSSQAEQQQEGEPAKLQVAAVSPLGRDVDLTDPQVPLPQQMSLAATIPAVGQQAGSTTSVTQLEETFGFSANGDLTQFDAPFAGAAATYINGTAAIVDAGTNAATGIRWGRWSGGSATVNTAGGIQQLSLTNSSLHWIIGPTFELVPVLPVSGTQSFTLAGGTNPTDDGTRVGTLGGAVFAADFTAQQVSTTLSLDVNGYNWFATGTGAITAGTPRFGGTFNGVLIDGRLPGTGSFNGFFSAAANTPDQLNGVGFGYRLLDSSNQLGTVSGVIAFVPGIGQAPTAPVVSRDLAYSVGGLNGGAPSGVPGTNTVAQLGLDANGNLTAFVAPVTRGGASGTFQLGAATVTDTGADAATGLRWGRWAGGTIDVTVPPGGPTASDLGGGALHWIVGTGFGAAPALPQAGTATYALVGNTVPTDTRSNLGTLGAASFSADFTNLTVASALSINVGGFSWYANGTGTFTQGTRQFTGTYNTVGIENLLVGNGTFGGFFTVPRIGGGTVPGAGLEYILQSNTPELGAVNGVLAFAQGQGNPVPPPPLRTRDIAVMAPIPGLGAPDVQTTPPAGYAVDGTFSLTRLTALAIPSDPAELGVIDIGTSTVAETNASAITMLRWGRWAGNSATFTGINSGQTGTIDLTTSSLHWIETADLAGPPVMPTTGAVSYVLGGATAPTDRAGNIGTLNAATFDADFTNQLVTTSLDLTINNLNWVASGVGAIGGQAGLPAHQFAGFYNQGIINPVQGSLRGEFAGFFSAAGSTTPGVPGGVGLTYSLQDGQGLNSVDGAIVFQGP